MKILAFPETLDQARALARALGVGCDPVELHRFPDGESRVRVPAIESDSAVALYRSLDHPNGKLVELMLAASAVREAGAGNLALVAPYLCYMRQDKAFQVGEVVSQRVVGRWLAELVDAVITVDPHLHRVATLEEAVPAKQSVSLTAAPLMGEFLARRLERPLLIGPDEESLQWVKAVAEVGGLDFAVARKERRGDREVTVDVPDGDYSGRAVVLVDDVASTGRTLAAAARALRALGAARVDVMVSHALFAGDAQDHLRAAGVAEIWSTDSIPHASNVISLARPLAQAVRSLSLSD